MSLPRGEPDVPYGYESDEELFAGYNLRGLIVAYLESRRWRWDTDAERWSHYDRDVSFGGSFATDNCVRYQIEWEEGRL